MNLPERIKKARQSRGLTQDELAEKLSVHITTVHRWEHGNMLPRGRRKRELLAWLAKAQRPDLNEQDAITARVLELLSKLPESAKARAHSYIAQLIEQMPESAEDAPGRVTPPKP